jgi:lipopolysaccharide/colanic/teichoic acid biosynthesis glycosyltransferase
MGKRNLLNQEMQQSESEAPEVKIPMYIPSYSGAWHAFARFFQIVLCSVLLVLISPLLILVAVLVEINSPGPFFYYGTRVGRGSTLYKVLKFRTLPVQYENMVGSRILTPKERTNGVIPSIITRAKLDELPQIINVIKGEMAFVGPRPVRPVIVSKYTKEIPGYSKKFAVKPGMTGLAQIIGGYYMAPADKHKYDLLYMKHISVFLDLKIIFLTFVVLVLGRRIMKSKIIERFLGFNLNVRKEEIEPTQEVFKKVTDKN